MKVAIMQPYFFPYLGYFQLMNAVDLWVNMDHASFIKKGFMHKNIIEGEQPIRLPLLGASQNKNTREIQVDFENKDFWKLKTTLEHKYSKAPFFDQAMDIFKRAESGAPDSLAAFNLHLIHEIHSYLGMETKVVETSIGLTEQKKADGMIEIAQHFGADEIYNPIGGAQIYDKEYFRSQGIELRFLKLDSEEAEDKLSIFHHLCHSSAEELKGRLNDYILL